MPCGGQRAKSVKTIPVIGEDDDAAIIGRILGYEFLKTAQQQFMEFICREIDAHLHSASPLPVQKSARLPFQVPPCLIDFTPSADCRL